MKNYISINNQKIELTDEQVEKLKHKVKEVVADRAVITYGGITVAAVRVEDLEVL